MIKKRLAERIDKSDYYDTFAQTIDGALSRANFSEAVLVRPEDVWNLCQNPLPYGETRQGNFPLEAHQGRATKKFFHVSIYRTTSGRYELTIYIL